MWIFKIVKQMRIILNAKQNQKKKNNNINGFWIGYSLSAKNDHKWNEEDKKKAEEKKNLCVQLMLKQFTDKRHIFFCVCLMSGFWINCRWYKSYVIYLSTALTQRNWSSDKYFTTVSKNYYC